MGIQLLGLIFVPVLLYMICRKYYLNKSELELLVSSLMMVVALLFDNWWTYVAYLCLVGWHTIIVLNMSRFTYFFDRNKSTHQFSKSTEFIFKIEEEEIILILYAIIIWIWVRVLTVQSTDFTFNGGTFLTLLHGWNCTFSQFWWINLLWTALTFLSAYSCSFLLKYELDRNNLYKSFLLKYKIAFDRILLLVVTLYNLVAFLEAKELKTCLNYYENGGIFFRLVWFWGLPLSTIIFFFKKHGEFSIEAASQNAEKAEKEVDLEQKLNHQQIDRQHSQISNKSQVNNSHGI